MFSSRGLFGARRSIMPGDQPGLPDLQTGWPQQEPQQQKRGLFGSGTVQTILGAIGDGLIAYGGGAPTFANTILAQREREGQAKAQQEQAEAKRAADWEDWQRKFDYERDNPKPSTNDTVADYEFLRQQLGDDAAKQYLRNMGDPMVTVPLPNGQVYSGPRSGLSGSLGGGQNLDMTPGTEEGMDYVPGPGGRANPSNWKPTGGQPAGPVPFGGKVVGDLDHITMMAESGGDPRAVSPKGARGLMQVMPETARDPGFGIRPSNGSPQDDVRVGKEYRAKMQARYGGDLAKMWAAYNWGPGNVDKAIANHGEGWFNHAPAETRNYVARNLRAATKGR